MIRFFRRRRSTPPRANITPDEISAERSRATTNGSLNRFPFEVQSGWPESPPESVVSMLESSILIGRPSLGEGDWAMLARGAQVFAMLINDHEGFHESWCQRPDGTVTDHKRTVILDEPVPLPTDKSNVNSYTEWVHEVFGTVGRLMLWDSTQTWWILEDDGLELTMISAPAGKFSAESEPLDWLTDAGNASLRSVADRYGISAGGP